MHNLLVTQFEDSYGQLKKFFTMVNIDEYKNLVLKELRYVGLIVSLYITSKSDYIDIDNSDWKIKGTNTNSVVKVTGIMNLIVIYKRQT